MIICGCSWREPCNLSCPGPPQSLSCWTLALLSTLINYLSLHAWDKDTPDTVKATRELTAGHSEATPTGVDENLLEIFGSFHFLFLPLCSGTAATTLIHYTIPTYTRCDPKSPSCSLVTGLQKIYLTKRRSSDETSGVVALNIRLSVEERNKA
jgi:hypothetical protein